MNCSRARTWLTTWPEGGAAPHAVVAHIAGCLSCQEALVGVAEAHQAGDPVLVEDLRRITAACRSAQEQLPRYVTLQVDGGAPATELAAVHTHLATCPVCTADYEVLLELVRLAPAVAVAPVAAAPAVSSRWRTKDRVVELVERLRLVAPSYPDPSFLMRDDLIMHFDLDPPPAVYLKLEDLGLRLGLRVLHADAGEVNLEMSASATGAAATGPADAAVNVRDEQGVLVKRRHITLGETMYLKLRAGAHSIEVQWGEQTVVIPVDLSAEEDAA